MECQWRVGGPVFEQAGSVGRAKAEVVGEVVNNDYNLEKLFVVFLKMCGLPLHLRIVEKCSDGLIRPVLHLRASRGAFLNVIFTGPQVTSTFQLGEK